MKTFLWTFLCIVSLSRSYGVTPIFSDYEDKENVFTEFRNLTDNLQDISFTQVDSTPAYQNMKDGEIMIYVSTPNAANINLMLRAGTTVYVSPMFPIIRGR